ncbi:MAG: FtsX-like permease family protein, partial [Pseudomonadota bacterium]|nr:FtsX-like permease family protein [Pseudomonadota bacterium]
ARQRLIGAERLGKDGVGMLWIKLYESGKTMVAEEKIREILRARHRLKPGEDDDFAIRNIAEMLEAAETSSRIFTLMLASIAAVSLIVGGIGIMNIMLVSVTERTREIGLRMALGARRRDIRFQFLIESLLLCVLGGMIGIAIGIGGAFTISRIVDWALVVSPLSIVLAFTFSAGVGLVFGWLPARRAARLDPVESLRYE